MSKRCAFTTQNVCGTDDNWESDFFDHSHGLIHRVCDSRSSALQTNLFHRLSEQVSVFCRSDCLATRSDHFYVVFVQHSRFKEFDRQVESCLTSESWQNRIWPLTFDDRCKHVSFEWFYVGSVCEFWVGHDRCWIRVRKNYAITLLSQYSTRLRP